MKTTDDSYLTLHSSKPEAWEHCQDLGWIFVMLDESGHSDSSIAQKTLRQYACQLARDYWHLIRNPDLRTVVETTEKFILGKVGLEKFIEAGNAVKEARSNSTKETPSENAAKLAEYCAYPSAKIAAALAAKYALKLGADKNAQIEILRELVGNPYLAVIGPTPLQDWWQYKPKQKNPIDFLLHKLNVWANPEAQKRVEFHNFLSEHSSLTEA